MGGHRHEVRVYYEDTDFSGAVYHAAYLHFFERGRTEFLRTLGVHHSELMADNIAFAVRHMEIDFARAARIDDVLVVETAVRRRDGVRLVLEQAITRGDEPIAQAVVTIVAVRGGKASRLPAVLVKALGPAGG